MEIWEPNLLEPSGPHRSSYRTLHFTFYDYDYMKEPGIKPIPVEVLVPNYFSNVPEDFSSLLPNHPYIKNYFI